MTEPQRGVRLDLMRDVLAYVDALADGDFEGLKAVLYNTDRSDFLTAVGGLVLLLIVETSGRDPRTVDDQAVHDCVREYTDGMRAAMVRAADHG